MEKECESCFATNCPYQCQIVIDRLRTALAEKEREIESWKRENCDNVEMGARTIKDLKDHLSTVTKEMDEWKRKWETQAIPDEVIQKGLRQNSEIKRLSKRLAESELALHWACSMIDNSAGNGKSVQYWIDYFLAQAKEGK